MSNFTILHVDIQFLQPHFLKRLTFLQLKIIWQYMWEFISGLSILFQWCKHLSIQYQTFVIISALQYTLKSASVKLPALYYFSNCFAYSGSFGKKKMTTSDDCQHFLACGHIIPISVSVVTLCFPLFYQSNFPLLPFYKDIDYCI